MDDILDQELAAPKREMAFYRDFIREEDALAFAQFLAAEDIPYSLEVPDTLIDKVIVGEGFVPKAIIKLATSDFEKVNQLLAQQVADLSVEELNVHPLNDLDHKELIAILSSQEEWTVEDITIAQRILTERGIPIDNEGVQKLRKERFSELRKGQSANRGMMLLYAIAMVSGPFYNVIFLIAGVGMSYYYAYGTTVDADGEKYFIYDEATRKLGRWMLFGGAALILVMGVFWVIGHLA